MASTSAGADRIVERPGRSNSQDVAATKSDVKSILRTKVNVYISLVSNKKSVLLI